MVPSHGSRLRWASPCRDQRRPRWPVPRFHAVGAPRCCLLATTVTSGAWVLGGRAARRALDATRGARARLRRAAVGRHPSRAHAARRPRAAWAGGRNAQRARRSSSCRRCSGSRCCTASSRHCPPISNYAMRNSRPGLRRASPRFVRRAPTPTRRAAFSNPMRRAGRSTTPAGTGRPRGSSRCPRPNPETSKPGVRRCGKVLPAAGSDREAGQTSQSGLRFSMNALTPSAASAPSMLRVIARLAAA